MTDRWCLIPKLRLRSILLGSACALLWLTPRTSLAAAKWTVGVFIGADYPDVQERLRDTGASDDVNVVVLHSIEGLRMSAYKLLKDPNAASHPAGQCCPNDQGPCCDIQNIPLQNIPGLRAPRITAANMDAFYKYLQTTYPAEHYLLVNRGHMTKTQRMLNSDQGGGEGLTVVEYANLLKAFVDRQGGRKIDVVVNGFCIGGNADWSYAFTPYVDYHVASPNFSSPPIAMRWRIYRWSRELIEKPTETARTISGRIVDIFADTNTYCRQSGHYCSLADQGNYWTSSAYNASRAPALAKAVRNFVCTQLDGFDQGAIQRSVQRTARYGYAPWHNSARYDLEGLLINLKAELASNPTKIAAIDALLAAHDKYVYRYVYEKPENGRPGFTEGQANGMAVFLERNYGIPEEIGPFQIESLWKAFVDRYTGSGALPKPTGVTIEPTQTEIGVGQTTNLTARGSSTQYPIMCGLPSIAWTVDNPNVASLSDPAVNPVVVTGKSAGVATIRATYSGMTAEFSVTVKAEPVPPPAPEEGEEGDEGEGHADPEVPVGTGGIDEPVPTGNPTGTGGSSGKKNKANALAGDDGCNCRVVPRPNTNLAAWGLALSLLCTLGLRRRYPRN